MAVSVLIPFTSTDPHRLAARDHITALYHTHHPDWELVEAGTPGPGPWIKAAAVGAALARSSGDTLVVADADVWSPGTPEAVDAVLEGAPWVMPHRSVHRLTPQATTAVLAGAVLQPDQPTEQPPYRGWLGGGIVILPRTTYQQIPLDPRFHGWGQEDASWAHALTTLAGPPTRLRHPLFHLWHPTAPRLTRRIGSDANAELERRYIAANGKPHAMSALLEEVPR